MSWNEKRMQNHIQHNQTEITDREREKTNERTLNEHWNKNWSQH